MRMLHVCPSLSLYIHTSTHKYAYIYMYPFSTMYSLGPHRKSLRLPLSLLLLLLLLLRGGRIAFLFFSGALGRVRVRNPGPHIFLWSVGPYERVCWKISKTTNRRCASGRAARSRFVWGAGAGAMAGWLRALAGWLQAGDMFWVLLFGFPLDGACSEFPKRFLEFLSG